MAPFLDADRPRAPKHPDAPITERGRHGQRLLVGIHDHLRHEMAQVVEAVDAVAAGEMDPGDAKERIDATTMVRNHRWFASFCGRYCQVVETHHLIEDRRMFVDIATADPTLQPVIDRLSEEHRVIHDILERLVDRLVALYDGSAAVEDVAGGVRELQAALLSHLDYEEEELLEPIGRLSLDV